MRQNIKITKREMKEDKFTTFVLVAKDYVLRNWIYFVGAAAAVIIVVVGVTLIRANQAKSEQQASEIYNRGMNQLRSGNHQLAIVDLKTVVDEYGSSGLGRQAAFDLGNAYFGAKNFAEAKNAFEKYLADYSDNEFFVTSAMAGVAASLAGMGEMKEAADKFREIAETYPDFALAGEFYLKAMHNYIRAGQLESARVIYAKLVKDFKDTEYYLKGARLAAENNIKL